MEINIKIGKKELLIFLVVALVATGIGIGTWLGIKRTLEREPDPFALIVISSEDLGSTRRLNLELHVQGDLTSLITIFPSIKPATLFS